MYRFEQIQKYTNTLDAHMLSRIANLFSKCDIAHFSVMYSYIGTPDITHVTISYGGDSYGIFAWK